MKTLVAGSLLAIISILWTVPVCAEPIPASGFRVEALAAGLGKSHSTAGSGLNGFTTEIYVTLPDSKEIVRIDDKGVITSVSDLSSVIGGNSGPWSPSFDQVGTFGELLYVMDKQNKVYSVTSAGASSVFYEFTGSPGWLNGWLALDPYGRFGGDMFVTAWSNAGAGIVRMEPNNSWINIAFTRPGIVGPFAFGDSVDGYFADKMLLAHRSEGLVYELLPSTSVGDSAAIHVDYADIGLNVVAKGLEIGPGGVWGTGVGYANNELDGTIVRFISATSQYDTVLTGLTASADIYLPRSGMFAGWMIIHENLPGNIWLFSPDVPSSTVIDFEMLAQGVPTVDQQLLTDQFEEDFGVTFSLVGVAPGIGPRIGQVGPPQTAWWGPLLDNGCDASGASQEDMPAAGVPIGCRFLTDDNSIGLGAEAVRIDYSQPVRKASGQLMDVDWLPGPREEWAVISLRSDDTAIDSLIIAADDTLTGDGLATTWRINSLEDIYAIELRYTGDTLGGTGIPGFAFDNFSPAWAPCTAWPDLSHEFDSNDDNWTILTTNNTQTAIQGGSITPNYFGSGGNPGGHLEMIDPDGLFTHYVAPASLRAAAPGASGTQLQFDLWIDFVAVPALTAEIKDMSKDVILISGTTWLSYNLPRPLLRTWTTYTVPLVGFGWTDNSTGDAPSQAEFDAVLQNLDEILIRAEFWQPGPDIVRLDNVSIGCDPCPPSAPTPIVRLYELMGTSSGIGWSWSITSDGIEGTGNIDVVSPVSGSSSLEVAEAFAQSINAFGCADDELLATAFEIGATSYLALESGDSLRLCVGEADGSANCCPELLINSCPFPGSSKSAAGITMEERPASEATSVDNSASIPRVQPMIAAPNPFQPSTTIRFDLPRRSKINISVYDIAGRLVATLVDDQMPAGRHSTSWSGMSRSGKQVSPGIYFAHYLIEGQMARTLKLVRLR